MRTLVLSSLTAAFVAGLVSWPSPVKSSAHPTGQAGERQIAVFKPAQLTVQASQAPLPWPNGKRSAIVLTYDDSLHSQLDIAIPQLDEFHLTGTFFLNAHNMGLKDMVRWRAAAQNGHELGNHSVFHPCPRAAYPHPERYATENYDTSAILGEIAVMNDVLFGIDGRESRTYATPCAQSVVGGSDYTEALRRSQLVKYNRDGGDAYNSIVHDFTQLDPLHVPSYGFLDHPDGARLIDYIKRVQAAGGLGILMFHGVGGDYLEVSADAHKQLLAYLRDNPDIWVGTFQEVMDYVTRQRPPK